jgi:dephospho-CoA kinase
MIKAGITGSIGSGKSVVCSIFECLGVPIFHADRVSRTLLDENKDVQQKVTSLLGNDVFVNGKPDRKKIAYIVFNNAEKLAGLNAIIHPAVREAFGNWLNQQKASLVLEEAAIMFESGAYKGLDMVMVVTAPEKLRIERVMKRDGITETDIRSRMKNQWTEEEKVAKANHVLVNDDHTLLIPQVLNIYKELTARSHSKKG